MVLIGLAEIENSHANHMLQKVRIIEPEYKMPSASTRAKMQLKAGV